MSYLFWQNYTLYCPILYFWNICPSQVVDSYHGSTTWSGWNLLLHIWSDLVLTKMYFVELTYQFIFKRKKKYGQSGECKRCTQTLLCITRKKTQDMPVGRGWAAVLVSTHSWQGVCAVVTPKSFFPTPSKRWSTTEPPSGLATASTWESQKIAAFY